MQRALCQGALAKDCSTSLEVDFPQYSPLPRLDKRPTRPGNFCDFDKRAPRRTRAKTYENLDEFYPRFL
jgi:hypothetical protein